MFRDSKDKEIYPHVMLCNIRFTAFIIRFFFGIHVVRDLGSFLWSFAIFFVKCF